MKLKNLSIALAIALIGFMGCAEEKKISPSPNAIKPNKGWNGISTNIEITGEGFLVQIKEKLDEDDKAEIITNITASLEDNPLKGIIFHNSQKLTAIVPAGLPPGIYDLTITNPDGKTGILLEAFVVTNIGSIGPTTGCPGEPVTISGSYFGPDTGTVSFNGTEATVISWSDTSIVISAPGGDYTEVTITPAAGDPNRLPGTYSYDDQAPTGLAASPTGGSYCGTVTVSLSASDGVIYYILEGSGPVVNSIEYTGPINIREDATLKFMAEDACGNKSDIVIEVYDIENEAPTGLTATPASGSYCATAVSLSASDGTIYYTTDGGELSPGGMVYTGPIPINEYTVLLFMAVDACGNQSEINDLIYDIDTEAVVTITSPIDGVTVIMAAEVTVSGDITVTGTADTDITTVTVTTDQGHSELSAVDPGGNWSVVLLGVTVSSIVITAQGTDYCENVGSDSVTVTLNVPTIWYVNTTATGDGTGTSWDNAFTTILPAVDVAASGHMIWVAEGTYNAPDNTMPVLTMKDGVEIYGGFVGTEVPLSVLGNPADHPTILDGQSVSYHVVVGASNARLDGFIVKGGNAIGISPSDDCGGGMYNFNVADLVVANCNFSGNTAGAYGGGMYNEGVINLVVTDCTFNNNWVGAEDTEVYGGGMANLSSNPEITNCAFSENSAVKGGGIYNEYSSPLITNCIFSNNYCESMLSNEGGAIYNHGSSPAINNCTFHMNWADSGGGICNANISSPIITNSILWGDYAVENPEICNSDGVSTAIVTYSDVEGGYDGVGNIGFNPDADIPLFVTSPMGVYYLSHSGVGGETVNSPCVDIGSDTAANLGMDDKTTRTDGVTDTGKVDMGYHYEPLVLAL